MVVSMLHYYRYFWFMYKWPVFLEITLGSTTPFSIWPHLFRDAGHEKKRGEQLKWSLAFRLYVGRFPCAQLPATIQPGLAKCFLCI